MNADPLEEDKSRFAIYISHSWRPRDVELNLRVWGELGESFELLVDVPEELGADPPYYINRIEELLRRADFFLGVLTHREPRKGDLTETDSHLRCSPYSLFEIRLAERADIPRLVLYERSTSFQPPRNLRPWEVYLPFDRGTEDRLPEQHQWTTVIKKKIRQWKSWVMDHRKPASYEQSTYAVALVDSSRRDSVYGVLEASLQAGGFQPVCCNPNKTRSSEAFRILREAGLVLAEFGIRDDNYAQLYAAAHGLGLPAIRMLHSLEGQSDLPWILQGDSGGHQNDIVRWSYLDDLLS